MKRIGLNLSIIILLLAFKSFAQPASNLLIFKDLAQDVFSQVKKELLLADSVKIIVQESRPAEENWIVKSAITNVFQKNSVLENFYFGNEKHVFFVYDVGHSSVIYAAENDSLLTRYLELTISLAVKDKNEILYSNSITTNFSDNINSVDVEKIESKHYSFTFGKRKRGFLASLFSPVLTSAATAAVIYIFYSFRSN